MSASHTHAHKTKQFKKINLILSAIIALCVALAGYIVFVTLASPTTSLYMQPSGGTFNAGDTITVNIRTNTGGENVNAVQANFSYPADRLQYQSVNDSNSAFGIAAASSGGNGSVSIARGNIANVNGDVLIARVTFKALSKTGSANLAFTNGSAVVRSSDSTNALATTSGANYTIQVGSSNPQTPTNPTSPNPSPNPSPSPSPSTPNQPSSGNPTSPPTGDNPTDTPGDVPAGSTQNDISGSNNTPSNGARADVDEQDSYFFGLSNQTVLVAGVGLPLAIAALAGAAIYLRWRNSAKILQSSHNFSGSTFASSSSNNADTSSDLAPAQPQTITPTTPASTTATDAEVHEYKIADTPLEDVEDTTIVKPESEPNVIEPTVSDTLNTSDSNDTKQS